MVGRWEVRVGEKKQQGRERRPAQRPGRTGVALSLLASWNIHGLVAVGCLAKTPAQAYCDPHHWGLSCRDLTEWVSSLKCLEGPLALARGRGTLLRANRTPLWWTGPPPNGLRRRFFLA